MSKLVVFLASPRKDGTTAQVLEQIAAGAASAGAEVVTWDLNDPGIRGCQGCRYCRTHDGCATQDALQPMYRDIREADALAAGFPIYFMGISGQGKRWLDRLFPFVDAEMHPRHPGKKVVTVYTQGNSDPALFRTAMATTDRCLSMMGWQVVERLLVTGTNDPRWQMPAETLDAAYAIGRELVGCP